MLLSDYRLVRNPVGRWPEIRGPDVVTFKAEKMMRASDGTRKTRVRERPATEHLRQLYRLLFA